MAPGRHPDRAWFPAGGGLARGLAVLAAALVAGLLLPGAAWAQIKVRKADCLVEAGGRTLINGACEFLTDASAYGVGGFRLATYENGYIRYGAIVTISSPGRGTATWSREAGGKPEDGPTDVVTSNGACWTGSRSRVCAWKLGEGRPGFDGPGAAAGLTGPRLADCLLEVGGESRLDGACQFRPESGQDGTRGFEIRSYIGGKLDILAQLVREPQNPLRATGYWNARSGALRAGESLGAMAPDGPCWQNVDARLCVWQPGQNRGAWARRDGGAQPAQDRGTQPREPDPAVSTPPPPPRDTAESRDPPPGTFLKLSFKGRCESLMIDGEDATAVCAPAAENTSEAGSPKAGFIFGTTDDRAMAFLASAKGWVEGGALHQPIDGLLLAEGKQSHTIKVKGTCEMPDPMGGPVVITCSAQSANSTYAVRFRTDGNRPVLEQKPPK
ncbi:hypothetical protein MKK63_19740 [Methylobacterium sp. J-088]|uniref:hypothetical protein n=1 Tax=Methylobacterium sp. J-088 TaxID=2836664 RepID=UPI001FB87AA0|nr:hypothetical protein [Methylobacterium sp. J-088]MCJ2064923.1 hypothetical protein [Methylobacterium sp. J-088]